MAETVRENRRVLLLLTAEAIAEALSLRRDLRIERIWQTDGDKSTDQFTICIRGESLQALPESWSAPYADIEDLREGDPT